MTVTLDAGKLIHNDSTSGGTITIRASLSKLEPSAGGKSGIITLRGIIKYINPAPTLEEKKARLKQRNRLIEAAEEKAASPGMAGTPQAAEIQAAADRLKTNNIAVERARLAQNVYNPDPNSAPPGWERVGDYPGTDGFHAARYRSQIDGTEVLAFEGTTMSSMDDWSANLGQGLGMQTSQYDQAITLAREQARAHPNIQLTGHSLGGGLASAGAGVTGAPTWTFNSAGLHPNTVERAGGNLATANRVTQTWHVAGEVLTGVQTYGDIATKGAGALLGNAIAGPAGGLAGALLMPGVPDAVGKMHVLNPILAGNTLDKHGIEHVIEAIESEKRHDIRIMQQGLQL